MEKNELSQEARRLLLDGKLLETTEAIALKLSHNYDWARRMIQEIALIFTGQYVKSLDIGVEDRGTSHAAFYSSMDWGAILHGE